MAIQIGRGSLHQSHQERDRRLRWITRAALLMAIAVLAFVQGSSAQRWLGIAVAVLWGLSLPFILRRLAFMLRGCPGLVRWQANLLLLLSALILLGGFVAALRFLVFG